MGNPTDTYAAVTYLQGRFAEFLDRLRSELVPGCSIQAHVTVLPPRELQSGVTEAAELIGARVRETYAFEIEATTVQVFARSNVVYADIGAGRAELIDLHRRLNVDVLAREEMFDYHPHLTLAQGLSEHEVSDVVRTAQRRWQEYSHSRRFAMETVTFVQAQDDSTWIDLAGWALQSPVVSR